ncbi:MAG: bifunctional adenosylcobinamide kinase/adenosylcobinamide-phosphate guanylyltransferase [Geminicoccaceae bacterium]|nr:MAG: bifunctional adenosylcobinamide kinase/adenosylcobinamide-phosphate guanylyltransferase [Geminicoccaceae bacterium]
MLQGLEPPPPPLVLALGGQRSGKSAWAERRTLATRLAPIYVATAEPRDDEMDARIQLHQARRGPAWALVEEPLALDEVVAEWSRPDRVLLIDCLTLWLSNLMGVEADVTAATDALAQRLEARQGPVVLVSNEVGSGVVPMHALARRFVDEAGRLHQRVAALATEVVLVTAGCPHWLKSQPFDD